MADQPGDMVFRNGFAKVVALVIVVVLVLGGGAALIASQGASLLSFGGGRLDEPEYRQEFITLCTKIVGTDLPEAPRNPTQDQLNTASLAAAQQARGFRDEVSELMPPDSLAAPHALFVQGLDGMADAYTEIAALASKGQMPALSMETPQVEKISAASGDLTTALSTMGYDGSCEPVT